MFVDAQRYFREQLAADTPEKCLALPTIEPTPITIPYDDLFPSMGTRDYEKMCAGALSHMFTSSFEPKNCGFENLIPLTQFVLSQMSTAEIDLEGMTYEIQTDSFYVLPSPVHAIHYDGSIGLSTLGDDIIRRSKATRIILSNCCSTAVLPNDKILEQCPPELDTKIFYAGVLSALGSGETDPFARQLEKNCRSNHRHPKNRNDYIACIQETVSAIRKADQGFKQPPPSHAIMINDIMIHGLTFKKCARDTPGAMRRVRILFDIEPKAPQSVKASLKAG